MHSTQLEDPGSYHTLKELQLTIKIEECVLQMLICLYCELYPICFVWSRDSRVTFRVTFQVTSILANRSCQVDSELATPSLVYVIDMYICN